MPFESNIVQVGMSGDGVVSRRGFLRTLGLGAAGLTGLAALPVSFTDLMVLQADELRKRQMACILLWMAGGPSQLETFDPKPGTEHGGSTKAIETSVPGISVAQGWDQTARVMKEITLVRSMTNKEGNHQRATYQLHTGYVPTATVKHPNIGCSIAAELGESKFNLPHIVSIGGPTIGAGYLGAALEPFVVQNVERPPDNTEPKVAVDRFKRRLGLLNHLETVGFGQEGGFDRVKERLRSQRLEQAFCGTLLHQASAERFTSAAADKHDRYGVSSVFHLVEQLEAGHSRHFDVHDQALDFA